MALWFTNYSAIYRKWAFSFFPAKIKSARESRFCPFIWFFSRAKKKLSRPLFTVFSRPLAIFHGHFLRIFHGLMLFCFRCGNNISPVLPVKIVENSEFSKIFPGIFCFSRPLFGVFSRAVLNFHGHFRRFFHGWKKKSWEKKKTLKWHCWRVPFPIWNNQVISTFYSAIYSKSVFWASM